MFNAIKSFAEKLSPDRLCPDCDCLIEPADINIREGFALCPQCGALTAISKLNHSGRTSEEVLQNPPSGCSIAHGMRGLTITVSLRSVVGFVGTTAVAVFWNSITVLFVSIVLAGFYYNLIGPVPDWFPAMGIEDGKPIMNDEPMSLGATLFMAAFMTPFVLIGAGMIGAVIGSLCGRVVVQVAGADSYAAIGAGPLLWKSRFDADQVNGVEFADARWQSDSDTNQVIKLTGEKDVKFGSMLSGKKQHWLQVVLREVLLKPRSEWRCRID